jgi:hypothetical protein
MERLYLKPSLCKAIAEYCEVNGIEDINAFANRCATQGLSIIKYGVSPGDNIDRENKGIKDFKNERQTRKKKEPGSENKREQKSQEAPVERPGSREEDSNQKEEKKSNVTVRKIRIIKKDKND